jgi:hypothetical protein
LKAIDAIANAGGPDPVQHFACLRLTGRRIDVVAYLRRPGRRRAPVEGDAPFRNALRALSGAFIFTAVLSMPIGAQR